MKTNILFLIFALLTLVISAQNYRTVNSDSIYFYKPASQTWLISCNTESSHNFIRSIRIDSIEYGTDSVLYSIPEVHTYDYSDDIYGCFNINSNPWCGKKIIIKNGGYNLYITRDNDTVKVNTLANLNENWKLYNFSNGDYVNAEVILHDTITFLGITDSAKTIELQVFDFLNNPITHELNDKILKISKNYGFVEMFNFRDFPISTGALPITKYTLIGVSDSINDLLLVKDVYNYEIGDEFHIRIEFSFPSFYQYKARTVIDKYYSAGSDTLFYVYNYNHWGNSAPEAGSYFHNHDTLTEYYTNLDSIIFYGQNISEKLPLESIITFSGDTYVNNYTMYSDTDLYNGRLVYCDFGQEFHNMPVDTCFYNPYFDSGEWQYRRYIKGCGDIYKHYATEMSYTCFYCSELIYFKKGTEECGYPLTIPTSIYSINNTNNAILIFPNPTTGKINIQVENIKAIEVLNELGVTILKLKETNELDLSKQPKGVYFIRITTNNETINKKITKQ